MQNLFKLRTEKKMSQLNLAMKLGVDQVTISSYELGIHYPSVDTLLKMCNYFNVSVDYLLDRVDIRTPVAMLVGQHSTDELQFIELYHKIPIAKRERLLGMMEALSE